MGTIDDIIAWYYKQADLEKLIRINTREDLFYDAQQEIALIILNHDRVKIIKMYDNNELKWFLIKIIKNQLESSTSPFYKKYIKYKKTFIELENEFLNENISNNWEYKKYITLYNTEIDDINTEEKKLEEIHFQKNMDLLRRIKKYLDNKEQLSTRDFHDTKLYRLYKFDKLSFRKIQKVTDVHYVSAYLAVKRVQLEIEREFGAEQLKIKTIINK